jgi:transcriptional regulator GlxA family with amidase domain
MIARFVSRPGRLVTPDVRCDLAWVDDRVILIGPMTHARLSQGSRRPIEVASFDPIAVRGWLNIPLHLVTDRSIPLADIEPSLAQAFAEKFLASTTDVLAIPGESTLKFKLHMRLALAVANLRHGATVRATAGAVEWSERQLERVFQFELGLTPKLFARIVRLRRALGAAKAGATLASAAANAGYADQSHFTRETQAFMSGSPSSLLQNVGNVQDILHGKMAD